MFKFDYNLLFAIRDDLAKPFLDSLFIGITKLGDAGLFWLILAALMLGFKPTRKIGIMLILALLIDLLFVTFLKDLLSRLRPYQAFGVPILIRPPSGSSFPSAHTSSSFVACSTLTLNERERVLDYYCLFTACAIAYSRLYLFVHYPTDVIIGGIVGMVIGIIVSTRFRNRQNGLAQPA